MCILSRRNVRRRSRTGKVGPVAQGGLEPFELLPDVLRLALDALGVLRGLEAPDIAQDRRAELHPSATPGALERILRVQRGRLRVFEVLADDGRLEQHVVIDFEERRLAERGHGKETRRASPTGLRRLARTRPPSP